MKEDLISVIIPAYNAERFIGETVLSVLKQSYSNFEMIIVDDGSTDSTLTIVEKFASKDQRIKILKQKNAGVSAARNAGFAIAKGKFIAFLDSDDVWLNNFLELLYLNITISKELGAIHCDYKLINDKSQIGDNIFIGEEGEVFEHLILGGNGKNIFCIISGALIKKEVIDDIGGFDVKLSNAADLEFTFRIAKKYRIGRVPTVGWYYRQHSNNMHSNLDLLENDMLLVFKRADEKKLFKSASFRRKCYSNMYWMLAGSFWKTDYKKSVKYIFKSLLIYPPNFSKFFK